MRLTAARPSARRQRCPGQRCLVRYAHGGVKMPIIRHSRSTGGHAVLRRRALAIACAAAPLPGAVTAPGARAAETPASLVNPIIGTSGAVNTFPGPDMPFGMIQWGPDTSPDRPSGGGYEYNDSQLMGYSLTHVSGPGCSAYGDLPIL